MTRTSAGDECFSQRQAKLTLVAVMPSVEMGIGAVEMGDIDQGSLPMLEEDLRQLLKNGVQALQD